MSYDVRIWSVAPSEDPQAHEARGRDWILNVSPSAPVLAEDIPDEVVPALPGIAYLTEIQLEGRRGKIGVAALQRAARAIAKATHGAIEDPQEDSVTPPSGVKRWSSPTRTTETSSLIELSWWTSEPVLLERATLDAFLDVLTARLPETLPRRYGAYEPPEHQLAKTGRTHLVDYLLKNLEEMVVMYPSAPVAELSVSTHRDPPWIEHGGTLKFRAHQVMFSIESEVLEQSGWATALRATWRELSTVLHPFYGDVRTTQGHGRSRNGRWWSTAATERHPVRSWWWGGVPASLGHAVVLGVPYLEAWPEFVERAELAGGLAFASTRDWASTDDVNVAVGGVPSRLAALPTYDYPRQYPTIFPFPRS